MWSILTLWPTGSARTPGRAAVWTARSLPSGTPPPPHVGICLVQPASHSRSFRRALLVVLSLVDEAGELLVIEGRTFTTERGGLLAIDVHSALVAAGLTSLDDINELGTIPESIGRATFRLTGVALDFHFK